MLSAAPGAPVHTPGTVFEIIASASGGGTTLAALNDAGTTVGTIVEEIPTLVRCTSRGIAYAAAVTAVAGGAHTVTVRASQAAAGTYGVAGAVTSGTFDVAVSDAGDPTAEVSAGPNTLHRDGISELRSLLRVGVPFEALVDASGAVTVTPR